MAGALESAGERAGRGRWTPPPAVTDLEAADGRNRLHRAAVRLVATTARTARWSWPSTTCSGPTRTRSCSLSELVTAAISNVVFVGAHRAGEFDRVRGRAGGRVGGPDRARTAGPRGARGTARPGVRAARPSCRTSPPSSSTGPGATRCRSASCSGRRSEPARSGSSDRRPDGVGPARADLHRRSRRTSPSYSARPSTSSDPRTRAVLSALACIGREFDLADAVAAAGAAARGGGPGPVVGPRPAPARGRRRPRPTDHPGDRPRRPLPLQPRPGGRDGPGPAVRRGRARGAPADRPAAASGWARSGCSRPPATSASAASARPSTTPNGSAFAEVQRRAAELARRQASFPVALACCRAGLALLGERPLGGPLRAGPGAAPRRGRGRLPGGRLALLEALLDEARADAAASRPTAPGSRSSGSGGWSRSTASRTPWPRAAQALDELGEPLPRRPGKAQAGSRPAADRS